VSLGSLDDHDLSGACITWPSWGLWWAEASLTKGAELAGRQSLVLGGVDFRGTVTAGGAFNGRAAYRLVAGAGGVSKALPKKSYTNDSGVSLAGVIGDAAREAGETVTGVSPTTRLGSHYARAEGETLGDLLERHFPAGWYANADGSISIGTRPATTYTGTAPRTRVDPAGSVIDLATDDLTSLVPGVQVDGNAPASDLQFDLTPTRLTARVYSASRPSRRLAAYRRIVRACFPSLAYLGCWEYRVVTATGSRYNLQPARVASGMPNLTNVPVRPGTFGMKSTIAAFGELVLVCFADGDPSRPQVFAHDAADSPSGLQALALQAATGGARPLARIGDMAGPFPIVPFGLPSIVSSL
jgi:hypothetical protein